VSGGGVDYHNGRWRARLPSAYDPMRRARYFDSESDAKSFVELALQELRGTIHDPKISKSTNLGKFGESFLTWWEVDQKRANADDDRLTWKNYVASTDLAKLPLVAIRAEHCQRWMNELAKRTARGSKTMLLSASVLRKAKNVLAACLRYAQKSGLLELGLPLPTDAVTIPTRVQTQDAPVDGVLSRKEIVSVLTLLLSETKDADEGERRRAEKAYCAFVVALFSGLRPQELCALSWEDVDLEGQSAHQRPSVHIRRSGRRETTKTGKRARIPLFGPAVEALVRWKAAVGRDTGLVFPRGDGGTHTKGYDFGWADHKEGKGEHAKTRPGIRSRAGIRRHVTWYVATKHTGATHFLMGTWVPDGWQDKPMTQPQVQTLLRHSSSKSTEHYARYTETGIFSSVPRAEREPEERGLPGLSAWPTEARVDAARPSQLARVKPGSAGESRVPAPALNPPKTRSKLEPPIRIERTTYGLRNRCSTD